MLARFERRVFDEGCKVWINRYKELYNMLNTYVVPETEPKYLRCSNIR